MSDSCTTTGGPASVFIGQELHIISEFTETDGTPSTITAGEAYISQSDDGGPADFDMGAVVENNTVRVDWDTSPLAEGVWFAQTWAIIEGGRYPSGWIKIIVKRGNEAPTP